MIARYLPNDGPAAREAMKLVTGQRIWMFDVGCAVGQVVGTCYQLESNTLKELQKLWNSVESYQCARKTIFLNTFFNDFDMVLL